MASELLMPKLGLTMTEGTIDEWKKNVGDTVQKGEILYSVATDKLTNDVEAEEDEGYNMPGVIVDGQNVFEVYQAAVEAVARARRGEGPTFIEAKTYRIEGHFVGDPEHYRSKEETMEIFHRTDPLKLFKSQCPEGVVFEQEELDGILSAAREKIAKAKEYAVSCEYPDPSEYLTDVYAE